MKRINWMSNSYPQSEGYGRYSAHMVSALLGAGLEVMPVLRDHVTMPDWMLKRAGVSWDDLTIACMPPYYLPDYEFPGRMWLLTMTEGGELPDGWAGFIHNAGVERVIVPCEHNRRVFSAELDIPVYVVPGGTDPEQFPVVSRSGNNGRYNFLALADRGIRKGHTDVWMAFHEEFGGPDDTPDVGLIVKSRSDESHTFNLVKEVNTDPRIRIWMEDTPHPAQVWPEGDCVVIPSRSEGWGMPHREAAMMGLPVIATRWGGLDDGHLDEWAIPLDNFTLGRISGGLNIAGDWAIPDHAELREKMRWCYDNQAEARQHGQNAAQWLRDNQTWDMAADNLIALLEYSEVFDGLVI